MKFSGVFYLGVTTFILILVSIFSSLDFSFPVVFYLVCAGQLFLILSVYKVLTDKYSTNKTFDDFYEDHPIGSE